MNPHPPIPSTPAKTIPPVKKAPPPRAGDEIQPARLENDLDRLITILSQQRSAGSDQEAKFVEWLKTQLPSNAWQDEYGNLHVKIGKNPKVLFSCHTDTTHNNKTGEAIQKVLLDSTRNELFVEKGSGCLGADDGVGVWLMLNMIDAKVPGHYIFHREEEIGGQGSRWAADNLKTLLRQMQCAIAFDRRALDNVITHQGTRTCSDEFAKALAAELNKTDAAFRYAPDDGGTFTDTKSYARLIPECTNISVGYYSQHSEREYLDLTHALRLRLALPKVKWSTLPTKRDPKRDNDARRYESYGGYGGYQQAYFDDFRPKKKPAPLPTPTKPKLTVVEQEADELEDTMSLADAEFLVARYPAVAAELLSTVDIEWEEIDAMLLDHYAERILKNQ